MVEGSHRSGRGVNRRNEVHHFAGPEAAAAAVDGCGGRSEGMGSAEILAPPISIAVFAIVCESAECAADASLATSDSDMRGMDTIHIT